MRIASKVTKDVLAAEGLPTSLTEVFEARLTKGMESGDIKTKADMDKFMKGVKSEVRQIQKDFSDLEKRKKHGAFDEPSKKEDTLAPKVGRELASEKSATHGRLKAEDEGRAPIEKAQQTGLTQDERLLGNLQAEMRQDRADDFDAEAFIKRNEAIESFKQRGSSFLKQRTK